MTAIIMRSWLEALGANPPPELAYIVSDHRGRHVVTWEEVLAERRKDQRRRLEGLRRVDRERAYKLWVGYFGQAIFGGWHAFLETYRRGRDSRIWIDRDRKAVKPYLMEAFPLLLPLWDEREAWERWKVEFARRYARRRQCRQPLGVAYLWWDGHSGAMRPASLRPCQIIHTLALAHFPGVGFPR